MWKFVKSATHPDNWWAHQQREICFIGRSNVGKSTLINLLAQARVARSSKTPGRTQLINYFQVRPNLVAVDLPGYGYARVSQSQQAQLARLLDQYFRMAQPVVVFVLIDARVGLMRQDEVVISHLEALNHQLRIVLTKCDRARQRQLAQTLRHPVLQRWPHFKSGVGQPRRLEPLRAFLDTL